MSRELTQEAKVVQVELADVGYSIPQHRETIGPHAEREALIAFRVDVDGLQHVRMHLSRAADFEPAVAETHVDLGGGLGEREERRPEAHPEVVTLEEVAQE